MSPQILGHRNESLDLQLNIQQAIIMPGRRIGSVSSAVPSRLLEHIVSGYSSLQFPDGRDLNAVDEWVDILEVHEAVAALVMIAKKMQIL